MSWKEQLWSLLIDGKFEEANELRLSKLPQELYRYRPIASLKDFEYRKLELLGNIYFSDLRGVNDPFDSRFMTRDSGGKAADAMNCAFYRVNIETLRFACFSEKKTICLCGLTILGITREFALNTVRSRRLEIQDWISGQWFMLINCLIVRKSRTIIYTAIRQNLLP